MSPDGRGRCCAMSHLPVILEIEHITTRNVDRGAAHAVNDWLLGQERTGRLAIPELTAGTLRKARMVQDRYAAPRLNLTDAVTPSWPRRSTPRSP